MILPGGDANREAAFSVAVVALILAVYNQTLPAQRDVAGHPADPASVAETRTHMAHAAVLSLMLAAGAGIMVRSWWPVAAGTATVAWMSWTYDTSARRHPT